VLAVTVYSSLADRLIAGFMTVVLVIVAATDLERRMIPNRVMLPATAMVLVLRFAFFPGRSVEFLVAAVGAGLFFLLPNLINSRAIGMGDVKLGVFLGAGLGAGVIGALLAGLISILPFAVAALIRGGSAARKAALPFAPFLAFGTIMILIVPRLLGAGAA
jgi:prepilin signal peptidase PulO-like enzyme (type II secretory pathway)